MYLSYKYVCIVTGYNEFVNNQDQVSTCAIDFSMLLYHSYSYYWNLIVHAHYMLSL